MQPVRLAARCATASFRRGLTAEPSPQASTGTKLLRLGAYFGVVGGGYAGLVSAGLLPPPFASGGVGEESAAAPPQAPVTEKVFMDLTIGAGEARRVVYGLYGDDAPRTAENFAALCASRSPALGYRSSRLHRVIPRFMVQGGDFTRGDGTGGTSVYGGAFPDETFALSHVGGGVLSMANRGPNTNTSQFFVTLRACPHLDGKHVVFGCVLEGYETIKAVEAVGSRITGAPSEKVTIVDCGRLPPDDATAPKL